MEDSVLSPEEIINTYRGFLPARLQAFSSRFIDEQKEVLQVDLTRGNAVVEAGPGSGKTTVLVACILKLALQLNCDFRKILVLTFTNAAAQELRDRIVGLLGSHILNKEVLSLMTFHSFCLSHVNTYRSKNDKPIVKKMVENDSLMKIVLKVISDEPRLSSLPINGDDAVRLYQNTNYRINVLSTHDIQQDHRLFYTLVLKKIVSTYGKDAMDYYSIITEFAKVASSNQIDIFGGKEYLFCDEIQDVDSLLMSLHVILLRKMKYMGVGDPNQTIFLYEDRHVNFFEKIHSIGSFVHKKLRVNHRSNVRITKALDLFLKEGKEDRNPYLSEDETTKVIFNIKTRTFEETGKEVKEIIGRHPEIFRWGILGVNNKNLDEICDQLKEQKVKHERWRGEKKTHRVVVSTIHFAKGCEFQGVIIVNFVEYVQPYFHFTMTITDVLSPTHQKRSKNVTYTGLSRAEDIIYTISPEDMSNCPSFSRRMVHRGIVSRYVSWLGRFCETKFFSETENKQILESEKYESFTFKYDKYSGKSEEDEDEIDEENGDDLGEQIDHEIDDDDDDHEIDEDEIDDEDEDEDEPFLGKRKNDDRDIDDIDTRPSKKRKL